VKGREGGRDKGERRESRMGEIRIVEKERGGGGGGWGEDRGSGFEG